MSRRTWVAAAVAALSLAAAVWLFLENRRLEREVASLRAAPAKAADDPWATKDAPAESTVADGPDGLARGLGGAIDGADGPRLPETPKESRMQRRARRTNEIAAMLGRLEGETDEEYRARILPLMEMALARPRENVAEMRRQAEQAAGVTDEQRRQMDAAFDEVYDELISYTNAAIQDGQLTPYERNVAGMLEYAGGLGAILGTAEQKVGGILRPEQVETMYGTGFEWAEYLGVSAPWEKLTPPPPPPGGGS